MPSFEMRMNCRCGFILGEIRPKNGQDCVYCVKCNRFQYNAPKTETGKVARTVETCRAGLKPRDRYRMLERSGGKCELCGASGILHVDHALSVEDGFANGLDDATINSPENLVVLCEACNLGKGKLTMPVRLLVAILIARTKDQP